MLANLFKRKIPIDDNSRQWIFDTFSWAITYFNPHVFTHETDLVLPTNDFYPGRVDSIEGMAQNIFTQTVLYSGMKNWPLKLVTPRNFVNNVIPEFSLNNDFRGSQAAVKQIESENAAITLTFNPAQINQPQDLIASYANQLATILFLKQKILPPGGKDYIPQAIDVLSCVMGFGVIFANTAYQFRGGCGSCNNPSASRQVALPENEALYCLAVFAQLKNLPNKEITPHLKSHLRSLFKTMRKDVVQNMHNTQDLELLS